MSNRPKPTALLALHGTTNVTRHRHRKHEPRPDGTLHDIAAPDHLTATQRMIWDDVLATLPRGLVTGADIGTFGLYVQATEEFRDAMVAQAELNRTERWPFLIERETGVLGPSPYVAIMHKMSLLLLKLGVELGMTPASRPRIHAPNAEKPKGGDAADPWAAFDVVRGGKAES